MNIEPDRVEKVGRRGDRKTLKDTTLWTRRQIKWTKFVEFCGGAIPRMAQGTRNSKGEYGCQERTAAMSCFTCRLWTSSMVWHSFMLNPRFFAQTCKNEALYKIRMPWKAIHEAINSRGWTFELGSPAEAHFEREVGVSASLFDQFSSWRRQDNSQQGATPSLTSFVLSDDGNSLDTVISAASAGESLSAKYTTLFPRGRLSSRNCALRCRRPPSRVRRQDERSLVDPQPGPQGHHPPWD